MGNSLHPSSGRAGISARRPVSYGADCKMATAQIETTFEHR
jgi:hypothetical protein